MSFYDQVWWKEAVGYQIYIKSFKDSNNDGIGDINGITSKLNYLKSLGVTLIWLTPFYLSPMDDNGYDVSDHTKIDPSFGSIDDFKNLVKQAHKKGIKIIIDLVLNHTSDEHLWFKEALKDKNSPYRDYYIWANGKNGKEPTNWASFFGGSAWKYDKTSNQYFMKIFSDKMPDLNWSNPKVRKSMQEVAKYWLDLKVDGFRVDAVSHLGRKKDLVDSTKESQTKYKQDWDMFSNLKPTFIYLDEFNKEVFKPYNALTIGEVGGGANPNMALNYASSNKGPLNMVFNFDHTFNNNSYQVKEVNEPIITDLIKLKQVFNNWQTSLYKNSWNPIYWLNHDHPRLVDQYGSLNERYLSSTMLASALYFKWGTPFIYQGEEIGMTNYNFTNIEEFDDVAIKKTYEELVETNIVDKDLFLYQKSITSRDNARTMMCWDSSLYAGFSTVKPWFLVNKNYLDINVEKELSKDKSIFKYYQQIFKLRKDSNYKETLIYGSYNQLLKDNKSVYAYLRAGDKLILTITNFFNKDVKINIDNYQVVKQLLSNYDDSSNDLSNLTLRKYEAITYLVKEV